MKKIYGLVVLALFLSVSTMAQITPFNNLHADLEESELNLPEKTVSNNKNKALEMSWLSPVTNWQDQGAFFENPTFMRLFPDSNVVIVPSDGTDPFRQGWHLVGTVFQPEEPFYELQSGWLMNRFDSYDVDSVRFPYAYQRITDQTMVNGVMTTVVDTAIIHYYKADQLDDWYMQTSANRFLMPNGDAFSVDQLGPTDVEFTDTVLLNADAATDTEFGDQINLGRIQFAIPDELKEVSDNPQAGYANCVGVSVTYKPMQSYQAGDTLVSFNENAQPKEQLNNFGTVYYANAGSGMPQEMHFNNTFVSNFQVRYGQDFGSIKGYLPTMAFLGWNRDLFFDADFYVTVDNPSSVSGLEDDLGLKAYPNPAKMGQEIIVNVDKSTGLDNISIVMTDLLGNVVSNEFTSIGQNEFSLATDKLAGGIYLISVNAENSASTLRVVIAD